MQLRRMHKHISRGGVCKRHGAVAKKCTYEGCTNYSLKGGVCQRHGAVVKKCTHEGCTNYSLKGGVCQRHGAVAKKRTYEGCTNLSRNDGVCKRHGAKSKKCNHTGCTRVSQRGGVCYRHGAKRKKCFSKPNNCTYEGCSNISGYSGGVFLRHSAKANKKICSSSEYKIEEHTLADGQNNNVQASIVIVVGTIRMKRNFYESNQNIVSASMTFSKRKKCLTIRRLLFN